MALRPVPDPGVLKEADAFRQAAQILTTCPESMMAVPTVVNAAFALELFLKSLNMEWQLQDPSALIGEKSWLASRTALQTGHAPPKLYSALNQNMRDTLEKQYRKHSGANSPTLKEALEVYDGLFQDWRYVFEGHCKSVELSALFSLLAFFSEALNGLPQQWA